ncbi:MAG: choice-of-anchor tandem repeat GloVer-containing protein [Bryobacteraceae bacterium]
MKTLLAALTLCTALNGQTLNTLYIFGPNNIGYFPGGVAIGPNGEFYGVTLRGAGYKNGAAFKLTPPAVSGGMWAPAVLHEFTTTEGPSTGGLWVNGITLGPDGVIYGTAQPNRTAGPGEVFALEPPPPQGGRWREQILHVFGAGTTDGQYPNGPPVFGQEKVLYGTTRQGGAYNAGVVYRLVPSSSPGGAWTEDILYNFGAYSGDGEAPQGALAIGSDGSLYGATEEGGTGYGTIFQLSPPDASGGSWTETVLHAFGTDTGDQFPTGVVMGPHGSLYGGTAQYGRVCPPECGVIFELAPPATAGGPWTETTLHTFTYGTGDGIEPWAVPVFGPDGALYGTTGSGGTAGGYGTIFKLVPPAALGATWTEVILYSFTGTADSAGPSPIAFGPDGNLYGITVETTTLFGKILDYGTAFQLVLQ